MTNLFLLFFAELSNCKKSLFGYGIARHLKRGDGI
jgi:hypothetical protein